MDLLKSQEWLDLVERIEVLAAKVSTIIGEHIRTYLGMNGQDWVEIKFCESLITTTSYRYYYVGETDKEH